MGRIYRWDTHDATPHERDSAATGTGDAASAG